MKVSLNGLLLRAASELKRYGDDNAYGFMLEELNKNLAELHDRHKAGDTAAIVEFFDIYVVTPSRQQEGSK